MALLLILLLLAAPAAARVVHTDRPPTTPAPAPRPGDDRASPAIDLTGLASTWCGTPRTVDEYRSNPTNLPHVKVVYAHPSDVPDRFAAYADLIQRSVRAASQAVVDASTRRRALRFDVGTACGTSRLDVLVVHLPRPRAYYAADDPERPTTRLGADVRRLLRAPGDLTRNLLLFADSMRVPNGPGGWAESDSDPRAGPTNDTNFGNTAAGIYGIGASSFVENEPYLVQAILHELMHLMGAVPPGAPNATAGTHCRDEWDVMCYADAPGVTLDFRCPGDYYTLRLDCGGDDYFHPAPPPNSPLRRRWNAFSSYFLCAAGTCHRPVAVGRLRASATRAALTVRYRVPQSLPVSYALERRTARGRWVRLGSRFNHEAVAGENVARARRRLVPGRHRVRAITGEEGAGQPRPAVAEFTVR